MDGRLEMDKMKKTRVPRERLMTEFRTREVYNLGKVQRAYLEANGAFTVFLFEEDNERDGLCILPDWDKDYHKDLKVVPGSFCCGSCGNIVKSEKEPDDDCDHCGFNQWHPAIRS